jgi:hypothetical protein
VAEVEDVTGATVCAREYVCGAGANEVGAAEELNGVQIAHDGDITEALPSLSQVNSPVKADAVSASRLH